MPDSTLSGLRRILASLERGGPPQANGIASSFQNSWLSTGHPGLDQALGGGLAYGALHELFAATASDAGALRGAATAIAALASGAQTGGARTGGARTGQTTSGHPVLWISERMVAREAGAPYAPGLALMGCDPARLVFVSAADTPALLSAACDAALSGAVAAVIAEAWGSPSALDLTATRRLTLAARGSGTLVVLARLGAKPAPSAAETRWRVASGPSAPIPGCEARVCEGRVREGRVREGLGQAPGLPVFDLTLLRHRRGVSGMTWRVAWMCHERKFQPTAASLAATPDAAADNPRSGAPLSGDLAAAPADRPAAAQPSRRVLRLAG